MVVEMSLEGVLPRVAERFRRLGRMLPEDVRHIDSWTEESGGRCFQLVEAPSREKLGEWIRNGEDLVEFEGVSVLTSADFWGKVR